MNVYYLAHPVRPLPGSTETVESNLRDAEWWLVTLQRANPGVAIIAPWIQEIRLGVGDDAVPAHRASGIKRCYGVASMLGITGVLITGPRIGEGSLGEVFSASAPGPARSCGGTIVHRFRNQEQSPSIPTPLLSVPWEFGRGAPAWMRACRFGAAPNGYIELVAAELLAAYERHGHKAGATP